MKRLFTATCFAAACAVGLSAQQPPASSTGTSGATTTAQSGQGRQGRMSGPMTLTGCVKAGDTAGTYMLTNIQRGDTGMGSGSSTTTASSSTTSGAAGEGSGMGSGQGMGMGRGMSQLMLNAGAGVDLSAHVGHKVEVTGTMAGGRGRMAGGGAATTSGAGGATTTAGSGATTSAGSGATTGGETGATTAGQGMGGGRGMRSMTVTAVKMISATCDQQ